jgi:hypothetical protein
MRVWSMRKGTSLTVSPPVHRRFRTVIADRNAPQNGDDMISVGWLSAAQPGLAGQRSPERGEDGVKCG